MNCSKCGMELENGAAFCGNCGQPVQAQAVTSVPQAAPAPAAQAPVMASGQPVAPVPAQPLAPATPLTQAAAPAAASPVAVAAAQPAPFTPAQPVQVAAPMPQTVVYPAAGGGKAIASLVLGILGMLSWLIPIFGIIFGVLALVFGTMSTKSLHRKLAITGIILASLTIALSLMAFVYNVQHSPALQNGNASSSGSVITPLVSMEPGVIDALVTIR